MGTLTEYNFTQQVDYSAVLAASIQASSISTALDHIDTNGAGPSMVTSVWFKDVLSSADVTTLDATMAAYINTAPAVPSPNVNLLQQTDSDNAILARIKQAPTGYTFQLHCFEIATGSPTVVNNDYTNAPLSEVTSHFYDSSNTLITDPTLVASQAVKSQFDFEPTYDYYIIGGEMRMLSPPTDDVRLSVVAVPDVPYSSGGSRPMIQSLNLKFLTINDRVQADGRAAKQLSYNATYHTNKLRFIFYHAVGEIVNMAIFLEFFK